MRLRRALSILICAGLLAGVPLRQAHAIPLLDQALELLAAPLALLLGGTAKLEAVIMVVNSKLPIMLKQVELKQREKLSLAKSELVRLNAQKAASAKTVMQNPPDPVGAACVAMTNDAPTVQAFAGGQRQQLNEDFSQLRNRGGVLGTRGLTGRVPSPNPIRGALAEARNSACRYGGPNDAARARECGTTPEQIKENPYQAADRNVTTVTNTRAFDDDKHFVASMDLCVNMTGNMPTPIAQGRALSESIDNIFQFNVAMADYAAQEMAAYSCLFPVFRKLPIDGKFAQNNPLFERNKAGFNATVNAAAGDGATGATRNLDQVDARARTFLMDPNAGAYTESDPKERKLGELPMDAQKQLIKGQKVSTEQLQEAEYIYKWYANAFTSKSSGGKTVPQFNVFATRIYNLQLMWHQYEQMERDLMLEAVQLARLVRQQQRDPQAATPN